MRTDVEQRLREGGIRVLTPPELLSAFGLPTLAATLRLRPAEPRPRALSGVHVSVALKQRVLPERNMAMPAVEAATWEAAVLGVVGPDAGPRVREDIATLVDRFVQAYRAVNPTPAAPTPPHPSDRPVPGAALIRQAQERLAAQGFHPGLPDGQMGAATPASPPAVPTCPRALPSRGNWMTPHNGHSASNSSGESSPTGAERRRLSRR